MKCPNCKDGQYIGFTTVETCRECGGTGEVPDADVDTVLDEMFAPDPPRVFDAAEYPQLTSLAFREDFEAIQNAPPPDFVIDSSRVEVTPVPGTEYVSVGPFTFPRGVFSGWKVIGYEE